MASLPQRPSLGETAQIGSLYDARNDVFLPSNLFSVELPQDAIAYTPVQQTTVRVDIDSSHRARFDAFGLEPALAGSVATKSVPCRGSTCFFSERKDRHHMRSWTVLYHAIHSSKAQLDLTCPEIKKCLSPDVSSISAATHVVTTIDYGVRSVITACYTDDSAEHDEFGNEQTRLLRSEMARLRAATQDTTTEFMSNPDVCGNERQNLQVTAYSDVLEDTGIVLEDLKEASDFLRIVPIQMRHTNRGSGHPILFSLLPVEMISMFLPMQLPARVPYASPPEDCLRSLLSLFDDIQEGCGQLSDYSAAMTSKRQYFLPDQAHDIDSRLAKLRSAEDDLKTNFPHALSSSRITGDSSLLWKLLEKYTHGESSIQTLKTFDRSDLKVADMLADLVTEGATYVGRNDTDPKTELYRHSRGDIYILNFSRAFLGSSTWEIHHTRFVQLLKASTPGTRLFIHDNDARFVQEDQPSISAWQAGQQISADLLEHEAFMRQRSFADCEIKDFETKDIKKPIKRRFVNIPCPAPCCSSHENKNWTCKHCMAAIEYGFSDDYIYCDCGRSKYTNYVFKCNGSSHDSGFHSFDSEELHNLLRNLASSNYLNILILGETGVGKSTFINALVNYLEFETLDDALAMEDLNWVIPCSFSTQIMDRTTPNAEIVERSVQVGSRADEKDGSKGESATQQTTVYSVTLTSSPSSSGYTTVRLIDTPGIGDTRGIDYDAKNMNDILNTLSSYDELHGILILLKSNAARLTITFQYCVKELLTHLHHSAAQNMVFGFTNTRISNYTPGDTFKPLKQLLSENRDVGLALSIDTTYCFDSESFRYLAAAKNALVMPNKADFDRSWKQSRDETQRLIAHFRRVPPHETRSTMSLNGARRNISELTKPMADISQLIRTNIALCEDQREELKDARITGDQLKARLDVQKIYMHSQALDRPRTVCTNVRCVDVRDSGNGKNELVTVYKTHCHAECYIDGVRADVLAPVELMGCAAFRGETCDLCGHHWTQHMHVLYELIEQTKTVQDPGIQQQLKDHASDITLRQAGILKMNETIREYEAELEIVRVAAAKFGVFLKKNSITPYNDALVAYLEFLIKAEQDKVQIGGNKAKMEALQEHLAKHHETVKVLTRSMNTNAHAADITEAGIQRTVQELYSLKHFGKMLENLQHGVVEAHQATYRERPHTVKRGNPGRSGAPKLQIRNPDTVYVTKGGNVYGGQHTGRSARQSFPGPQKQGVLNAIGKFFA